MPGERERKVSVCACLCVRLRARVCVHECVVCACVCVCVCACMRVRVCVHVCMCVCVCVCVYVSDWVYTSLAPTCSLCPCPQPAFCNASHGVLCVIALFLSLCILRSKKTAIRYYTYMHYTIYTHYTLEPQPYTYYSRFTGTKSLSYIIILKLTKMKDNDKKFEHKV